MSRLFAVVSVEPFNSSVNASSRLFSTYSCFIWHLNLKDITPHDQYLKCLSNEYNPLEVSWFEGDDLTDYDLINQFKTQALQDSFVFGLTLNSKFKFFLFVLLYFVLKLGLNEQRTICGRRALQVCHAQQHNYRNNSHR